MIDTPTTVPPSTASPAEAALDAWEATALEDVTLPSGTRVKILPGSLTGLMVQGVFPQPLMDTFFESPEGKAARLAAGAAGDAEQSDARAGLELMRHAQALAAAAVKAIWHAEAWQPVTVSVERLARLPIPDQVAIRRVALGDSEIAEVGLPGLAAFRGLAGGDAPGADGADVREPAVKPARPNRAARRARPRSDTRR